ncbi:MAG: OmpA family protein [gamma proteobacterium endosymbiont of Lamellibrachia anaximandri]|nr:OmpA family protein [gamma proteobacterium endosymbiont of Lamellibrachia anaximandri]MBL3532351.1 OmpA family protein [gamma proteobacterium endosymbiont of Lamellibrachia anaximandri]
MNLHMLLRATLLTGLMISTAPLLADDMVSGYVISAGKSVITDSFGNCVRTPFRDTTEKLEACGYEKPKPMAVAVETEKVEAGMVELVVAPTAATITAIVAEEISIAAEMLFEFDSANLSGDAKAVIDERIESLGGAAKLTSIMRIEGHTDSTGPEIYNQKLSERRAQAVADYILSNSYNVNTSEIEIAGMGESNPVASNETPEGRSENRRVVIFAEGRITN